MAVFCVHNLLTGATVKLEGRYPKDTLLAGVQAFLGKSVGVSVAGKVETAVQALDSMKGNDVVLPLMVVNSSGGISFYVVPLYLDCRRFTSGGRRGVLGFLQALGKLKCFDRIAMNGAIFTVATEWRDGTGYMTGSFVEDSLVVTYRMTDWATVQRTYMLSDLRMLYTDMRSFDIIFRKIPLIGI